MKALPNTNTLFTLLLACTELLISAPKITFLPSLLGCEKLPLESNPIPYPFLCLYSLYFFCTLSNESTCLFYNTQ